MCKHRVVVGTTVLDRGARLWVPSFFDHAPPARSAVHFSGDTFDLIRPDNRGRKRADFSAALCTYLIAARDSKVCRSPHNKKTSKSFKNSCALFTTTEARGRHFSAAPAAKWASSSTCSRAAARAAESVLAAVARDRRAARTLMRRRATPRYISRAATAPPSNWCGLIARLPRRRLRRRRRRQLPLTGAACWRHPTSLRCCSKRTPARPAT